MSLYGLAFACPVCPSTHAFGFSRLTLWILAVTLSTALLLMPARHARLQAIALTLLLFPMAWLLIHQAVNGWCPPCLAWWACALGMLLSRFPALLKIERMGVGIAVIAIVGGVAWTSRDPQVKGLAARLLSTQQTRVERLRAMLEPPPGLREGSLAPAVAQKYQGRIIVALPDCPPCVADTVNRFVAQLPERSAPIVLIPKGRMADVKDQPFARFAEEVDPSFFSAFHLTSSSPPYVLQLDEGRVKWCRPLSASHALLERWTAQSSNDLGAQTDQTVGAQKATNPKKEEKRK